MIYYAKILSSPFCYCRVDFYEIDNVLYLGELTFSPFNAEMKYNNQNMRIKEDEDKLIKIFIYMI